MVTSTTTKNMDTKLSSADQSLCGHLISLQGETTMHTTTIGITILEKVDVEHIKEEMKRTWQRRDGSSTSNGGITSPKRSSDHTSSD